MREFFPSPTSNSKLKEYDGFFLDFYNTGKQVFRMDNQSLEVQFTKWGNGEPSNENEKFIAVVGGVFQWQWIDVFPNIKVQTVCENET
ncbi:hypothetical protein DPMN_142414 [Dreissena polymorpha]|uniref:Uncharacterized protein n=1 Tax=Dreissena polymorpha TaxID=45954 RepID=A0A9D4GB92_DREPO|nr:hypothetical protein DPMN_142414 [Dreissena polymorpha]